MRSWVSLVGASVLLPTLAAGLAGCGSDDEPPAADCPTYAEVDAAPDGAGVKDFTVTLDLALMRDPDERAERIRDVGGPLCLSVTEERPLGIDAVLVDAGRPLDAEGQALLLEALRAVDGVLAAEPGAPDRDPAQAPG